MVDVNKSPELTEIVIHINDQSDVVVTKWEGELEVRLDIKPRPNSYEFIVTGGSGSPNVIFADSHVRLRLIKK